MSDNDVDTVRVALRIRPLIPSENERGCQEVVERTQGMQQVIVNRTEAFTFNYVFDPSNTQADVYNDAVAVLLDRVFGGFNATILAYGQTGSGKTHTMGTAFNGKLNDDVGVIPRAMYELFKRIDELSSESEFIVSCSFMELYQEQFFDLLSRKTREESIVDLREDRNGIIIPGLTEEVVRSAQETTACLVRGSSGRAVASTAMNQESSRSHAIFTVTLQATAKRGELKTMTTSKFHLVDLAGSERSKKTLATGDRFKEGVKINQGLLALGNVISALGSCQGSGFVRYRDSKLTRLLQDSLGGNSVTLMIACVSPADYNVPETLSTLRYADRARKIKNKPIVNQDPHAAEINHLKEVIQKLRMELLAAGGSNSGGLNISALMRSKSFGDMAPPALSDAQAKLCQQLQLENKELQEKYHNVQKQLQATLHDVVENEMRAHIAEAAHDKLRAQVADIKGATTELQRDCSVERLQQLQRLVDGLDEELERTQSEISDHRRQTYTLNCSGPHCSDDDDADAADEESSPEVHALMQAHSDEYTNKQMNFKEQLRRINRELNLKEELHQRVAGNLTKFCTLDENMDTKYKDCEAKIKELEAQKFELIDKLKHVKENVSVKLAEERRRRLQTLEQEINDMKRKNMQQAKLLKVREKETQKIQNLNNEIQAMKESKVKLIRAMRHESEVFRQWKLTREKELMQLRNKDRKQQNQMARNEALHTKQRNVLKRKCEEAMAINKRLKDALERQKVAQTQRQKQQTAKDVNAATYKMEQVIASVERELEVILSLIDAEHSLDQLMEDRCIIKRQIDALQKTKPTDPGNELTNLEEELEMRNAQIADLQQKICAEDLDARMRSLWDSIQSVAEGREVTKKLLKCIVEMRRENANRTLEQKAVLEDQRSLRRCAEAQCATANKRVRLMAIEHANAIAERENTYEEKIAVLLRELHHAPQLANGSTTPTPEQAERFRIQEEQLNKMDQMREELDDYRTLVNQLENAVQKAQHETRSRTAAKRLISDIKEVPGLIDITDSDELDEWVDDVHDPDWKRTPQYRKRSTFNRLTGTYGHTNSQSEDNSAMEETFISATTSTEGRKRRTTGCGCRGDCSTKRCGCFSKAEKCSPTCRCGKKCCNGKVLTGGDSRGDSKTETSIDELVEENEDEDKDEAAPVAVDNCDENPPSDNRRTVTIVDHKFLQPEPRSLLTPKQARLSKISFDTPSTKKKFFD